MSPTLDRYPEGVETLVGAPAQVLKTFEGDDRRLSVVWWQGRPEPALNTFVTVGLAAQPGQREDPKVELILSVASDDLAWGFGLGFLAHQAGRGFAFDVGNTLDFRAPISQQSRMSAFFVAPQMMLPEDRSFFEAAGHRIELRQLVPLYEEERAAIARFGPGYFGRSNPDICNVSRPSVPAPAEA